MAGGWEDAPAIAPAKATGGGWEDVPSTGKRWDVVGDFEQAWTAATQQLGRDVDAASTVAGPANDLRQSRERHKDEPWYQRFPAEFGDSIASDASRLGAALRVPFDALGVAGAPVAGAAHAFLAPLLSYLPGVNKQQAVEGLDQALLGMRPSNVSTARGALPVPAGLREAAAEPRASVTPASPKPGYIPEPGFSPEPYDPAAEFEPRPKTGPAKLPDGYDPVTGIDQSVDPGAKLPGRYDPATDPRPAAAKPARSFWERLTGVGEPPMPASDPRIAASRLAIARADRGAVPAGYDAARDISSTQTVDPNMRRRVDFNRDVERPPKSGEVQVSDDYDPATNIEKPSQLRAGSSPLAKRAITEDGLVLPPHMANATPPTSVEIAASAGGKLKTEQMASVRNERAIDRMAAKAIGLPEGADLSETAIERAKAPHNAAYDEVAEKLPDISLTYVDRSNPAAPRKAIDRIVEEVGQLSQLDAETSTYFKNSGVPPSVRQFQRKLSFDLGQNETIPTRAVMGLIRSYREQAGKNLRSQGPSDHWLGLAQRKAADSLEGLIERNLIRLETEQRYDPRLRTVEGQQGSFYLNQPDPSLGQVMKAWRQARIGLAKIHMVEDSLNPGTGHVRTAWIARQLQKGAPLTDELRRIGEYGLTFNKALRESASFGGAEKRSALDFFSATLSLMHGNPALAAAVWARPAARSYALSPGAQRSLVTPRQPIGPAFPLGVMQNGQAQAPPQTPDVTGIMQALGIQK